MNEQFKPEIKFTKDKGDLEMLEKTLKSPSLDKELTSVIEKFFSLPITPIESCYGHPERNKEPYFQYVEDEVKNEKDKEFQRAFRERVAGLADAINKRIGGEAVKTSIKETDHGKGPKDYTLRFKIVDKQLFQERGEEILGIIWEEFLKCLEN